MSVWNLQYKLIGKDHEILREMNRKLCFETLALADKRRLYSLEPGGQVIGLLYHQACAN